MVDWPERAVFKLPVSEKVPLDTRGSLYAELGDWLPVVCWGIIVGAWVLGRLRRTST